MAKKIILVTGGAQGLGSAISSTLAKENEVVVGDIQENKALGLIEQIKRNNGSVSFMRLDGLMK